MPFIGLIDGRVLQNLAHICGEMAVLSRAAWTSHCQPSMTEKELADRVQALEEKVGDRAIQDQLREQLEAKLSPMRAELIVVREGIRTILARLNRV